MYIVSTTRVDISEVKKSLEAKRGSALENVSLGSVPASMSHGQMKKFSTSPLPFPSLPFPSPPTQLQQDRYVPKDDQPSPLNSDHVPLIPTATAGDVDARLVQRLAGNGPTGCQNLRAHLGGRVEQHRTLAKEGR